MSYLIKMRQLKPTTAIILIGLTFLTRSFFCIAASDVDEAIDSEKHSFIISTLTDELDHPWGMAFLPNGDILITERTGQLRLIEANDDYYQLHSSPVTGLPKIKQYGQGGLLDIALHPDFKNNQLIYLSYAGEDDGAYGTEVLRGKYSNRHLEDIEVVFKALPKSSGENHFGSRLVFATDGTLFISLGERGERPHAQDLSSHAGSLIRINDDGTIPKNNPFVNDNQTQPEIFSYGHRNMQGMALQHSSGKIWTHEHGPQGGDEINFTKAGANFGWPVITYGVNYFIGTKIGEGTHKKGMEQPAYYWDPSIAPSGMLFYNGDQFPDWQENIFVGSLKFGLLVRLEMNAESITHEERLLDGKFGRIRDVRQGLDGNIYLLTDDGNGRLLKISPQPTTAN